MTHDPDTELRPGARKRALAFAVRIVGDPDRTERDAALVFRFARDSGSSPAEIAAATGFSEAAVNAALSRSLD